MLITTQTKPKDRLVIARARLGWARAVRDSKVSKMDTARSEIMELKQRIDEKKARIRILIGEKKKAHRKVGWERKAFRQELVEEAVDPRDPMHVDALSSDFEQLSTSSEVESEVDSDEEWLQERERIVAGLPALGDPRDDDDY